PCGTSRRQRRRTRTCSPGGTAPRWRGVCCSRRRPSRRASSPAHTRMRTSTSPSHNSTQRWARHGLASLLALAAAACPRPPHPTTVTPGAEPELRLGLAVGASSITLGGDGELFVTDDGTGAPPGSIQAGASRTVVPDTGGLRVVQLGGSPSAGLAGIPVVYVMESRFVTVCGRGYPG